MAYILKTDINENLNILSGLSRVHGVGMKRVELVSKTLGIRNTTKFKNLNTKIRTKIVQLIEEKFVINDDLKREIFKRKETFTKLKVYKGIRQRVNLPRRGQRTHTNAKTVKRSK